MALSGGLLPTWRPHDMHQMFVRSFSAPQWRHTLGLRENSLLKKDIAISLEMVTLNFPVMPTWNVLGKSTHPDLRRW